MSHVPNEFSVDFPEFAEKITKLKISDTHFSKLYEKYHTLNRSIHRAETDIEPTDDVTLENMRKERLTIKDELYVILKNS